MTLSNRVFYALVLAAVLGLPMIAGAGSAPARTSLTPPDFERSGMELCWDQAPTEGDEFSPYMSWQVVCEPPGPDESDPEAEEHDEPPPTQDLRTPADEWTASVRPSPAAPRNP